MSNYESGVSSTRDKEIDSDTDSDMNEEEYDLYAEALRQHKGFGDIPTFPHRYVMGLMVPSHMPYHTAIQDCAVEAIKHFNNKNATNYEFVKIVKANEKPAVGLLYYITFEGKPMGTPQDFPTTTFEAIVLSGIRDLIEVWSCELKSSNSS